MTIDSRWIKKDFKQKYFLYCKDCKVEKLVNLFGSVKNNNYICKKIIIKEKTL